MNFIKIVPLIIALFFSASLVAQEYQLYHQSNETNSLIFEEPGEIPISLSTIISGTGLTAYNIQLGYSPLKHLNLSGAYLKNFGSRGNFVKDDNSSYTFSLGTNYKIPWIGKTVKGKRSNRRILEKEKKLNFNLKKEINGLDTNYGNGCYWTSNLCSLSVQ